MEEKDLLNLKQEIEDAKAQQSRLQGHKESVQNQLLEDFGIKSIKGALKRKEELKVQIDELDTKIKKDTEILQQKLDGRSDPDVATENGTGERAQAPTRKRTPQS